MKKTTQLLLPADRIKMRDDFISQLSSLLGVKEQTIFEAINRNKLSTSHFGNALEYFKIFFPHPQITEGFTGNTSDLLDKVFLAVKTRKPLDMYMAFGGRISGEVPFGILKYVYYTAQVSRNVARLFGRAPKITILLANSYYLGEIMGHGPKLARTAEDNQRRVLEKSINFICRQFKLPVETFQVVSYDELRRSKAGRRFVKLAFRDIPIHIDINSAGLASLVNMAQNAKKGISKEEALRLATLYAREQVIEASLMMHFFRPALKVVEGSEEIFDVLERDRGLKRVNKRPSIVLAGQRKKSKDVHIIGPAYHPPSGSYHPLDNVLSYRGGDIAGFLARETLVRRGDVIRTAVLAGSADPQLLEELQKNPSSTYANLRKTNPKTFNRLRNFIKATMVRHAGKPAKNRRRMIR